MVIVSWIIPCAGLYWGCRLPDGMDATVVARKTLAQHAVLAFGSAFRLSRNFMRFNVAQTHDDIVYKALELSMNQSHYSGTNHIG